MNKIILDGKEYELSDELAEKIKTELCERLVLTSVTDVVEVVRCCECVHHDGESPYHYCRKWRRNCPDDSDFFCKWGERKEGDENND